MASRNFVDLVHLVGFVTGIALYAMLGAMIRRGTRRDPWFTRAGGMPLLAAVLGLVWNAGGLLLYGLPDLGLGAARPWFTAVAYSALGFLPAVVVDAVTRRHASRAGARGGTWLAGMAYAASGIAALMQLGAAAQGRTAAGPLLFLTIAYGIILIALAAAVWRRFASVRPVALAALAAFAVSALHLRHHAGAGDWWGFELVGDHASLVLVLVILYEDYRFALADLFLKRVLAVFALIAVSMGLYELVVEPWAAGAGSDGVGAGGIPVPALVVGLAVVTALAYPALRSLTHGFVDRVVLRRADYRALRGTIARAVATEDSVPAAMDALCRQLGDALSARDVRWEAAPVGGPRPAGGELVLLERDGGARVLVATNEAPALEIYIRDLGDGRRLLSDDVALLETAAHAAARRVDELRVADERYERSLREHEMERLATEAELRALRAQLNPHFLFNALNTIGHLVTTAPERALDTLYRLTALLRAVLRRVDGEFVPLREELSIVDAYLGIERARFEERLTVEHDVDPAALEAPVPPLLVQPLVENAVKHGIAPRREGGTVRIHASLSQTGEVPRLTIVVSDTGAGMNGRRPAHRNDGGGLGLDSVRRRLDRYFGARASFAIRSAPGQGTDVTLQLPVER